MPPLGGASESALVDESWVLPAVAELGGRPEVSDDGAIVYVFDDLTVSSVASDANLILADPALAELEGLDAAQLAALVRERIDVRAAATATPTDLRASLRAWAGALVEAGGARGGQREEATLTARLFPRGYLEEKPVAFSNADGGQRVAAAVLGVVNLLGVGFLGCAPPQRFRSRLPTPCAPPGPRRPPLTLTPDPQP